MATFDTKLADGLIRAYADYGGLTEKDCDRLGVLSHCRELGDALDLATRAPLDSTIYPDSFVSALIGPDGARGLHARLRWIANHNRSLTARQLDVARRVMTSVGGLRLNARASEDVRHLAYLLRDKQTDPRLRIDALRALGGTGAAGRAAYPAIVEILRNRDADLFVRCEAAIALGATGVRAAIPDLIAVAKDKEDDPVIRRRSVVALGEAGYRSPRDAIEGLIELLLDRENEPELRTRAVLALGVLGRYGSRDAADALIEVMLDEEDDLVVRKQAAATLADMTMDTGRIMRAQIEVLEDGSEDADLRRVVVEALGKRGFYARAAVLTLSDMVKNHSLNWKLRLAAVNALGAIDPYDPGSVSAFVDAVDDRDGRVEPRRAAAELLCSLSPDQLGSTASLVDIARDEGEDHELRRIAVAALGRMQAASALVDLLMDKRVDPGARRDCAIALGIMGYRAKEAIPILIDIVEQKEINPELRMQVAIALARAGAQEDGAANAAVNMLLNGGALPFPVKDIEPCFDLLVAMNDRDHEKRTAVGVLLARISRDSASDSEKIGAIAMLGNLGPSAHAAAPALVDIAENTKEDREVRVAAINALGSIWNETGRSVPALASLSISNEPEQLRNEAKGALKSLGYAPAPDGTAVLLNETVEILPVPG